ncbi:MAG: hypothetical protein U0U66_08780 [Cytophagaceae bacterium]
MTIRIILSIYLFFNLLVLKASDKDTLQVSLSIHLPKAKYWISVGSQCYDTLTVKKELNYYATFTITYDTNEYIVVRISSNRKKKEGWINFWPLKEYKRVEIQDYYIDTKKYIYILVFDKTYNNCPLGKKCINLH